MVSQPAPKNSCNSLLPTAPCPLSLWNLSTGLSVHCLLSSLSTVQSTHCSLNLEVIEYSSICDERWGDQSKIKPSGLGTIRLKLPGLPDFLLDHVLYLPQLKRNLLSLVHIRQQGHSIHMFDGKLEVRKASDHSLVMRGIQEERLLQLQGTSSRAQHFSYNSHHEEDQHVESSSEEHSPPHETPTTDDALSDVIDRIGRLNLDSVQPQSTEQPGPSEKGPPKWLTKTLESVHPDEVGKTGTRNSNRKNGGDVDVSNSPIDMDVSYDCELNLSTNFEPTSFKEATSHYEWKEAMKKEYDAFIKNDTWKLVDPPLGTKPIGCKWVYRNKYKADGSLEKHKARHVENGFAQKEGVDYKETFSPTTKWATIWTLFALAAQNGWKVHQMDVKTAFLNGDLKENVFMS
eukprot:PITA_09397